MTDSKLKLIIVDDHELFRDGIKTLFEMSGFARVIAEASDGIEFLELLDTHTPDIVLIDIDMPRMNGIEATLKALERKPDLKILALSMCGEQDFYYKMIEAGAKGFLLKTANKKDLEKAIHLISMGHSYFSMELLQEMVQNLKPDESRNKNTGQVRFSDKEIDIMKLMCLGHSTEEIANKVFLSAKTVANYRNIMLNKTGCKNSTNLVFYAIKNHIIEIE
jgi:DNA-binding NarL/FixJ family response regulator